VACHLLKEGIQLHTLESGTLQCYAMRSVARRDNSKAKRPPASGSFCLREYYSARPIVAILLDPRCDLLSRTAWQESPLVNCERATDCNTQNGGLARPFSLILGAGPAIHRSANQAGAPSFSTFFVERVGSENLNPGPQTYRLSRSSRANSRNAVSLRRYHIHWPSFLASTNPAFFRTDI